MTREHNQAAMTAFGAALLVEEEDFYADAFGQADVVPHLCETQWAESDARCIQHLGDPTFGGKEFEAQLRERKRENEIAGLKHRLRAIEREKSVALDELERQSQRIFFLDPTTDAELRQLDAALMMLSKEKTRVSRRANAEADKLTARLQRLTAKKAKPHQPRAKEKLF